MNEARQKIMAIIGDTGCYFDTVVHKAELAVGHRLDDVAIYGEALRKRWIEDDCFMNKTEAVYGYLVGGDWECRKEPLSYTPVEGDVVIIRYEWAKTGTTMSHFVGGDLDKSVEYDPYGKSLTVANGKPISLRIISRRK